MAQSNEQGGFNERLDAAIDLLPCITGYPWANGAGKGMTFSDGEGFDITEEVNAFKAAIRTLVLEEIIGEDEDPSDPDAGKYERVVRAEANLIRDEMRRKLNGTK